MALTSDLQLNILRRLQQTILPNVLVTPLASMSEMEPQPAFTPTPDPELGSPTPLPDMAALTITPTPPDLQLNPLYVAPAPALELTNPATDQIEVGGDSKMDQGVAATDMASTSGTVDAPTPADGGGSLTASEYLEHFDPLGTYSPASVMSVTEADFETMNDPQQPDLILPSSPPQNPQEKTEEEGPEAEVKDTPKSDDDHTCSGSDQDNYHPTGESP